MLLESLSSLMALKAPGDCKVEIILCDNDLDKSAASIIESFKFQSYPITYIVEPRKGIVFMRNRIIDQAITNESDFLAFIDDDEIADPNWLLNLYGGMLKYKADVAAGFADQKLPINAPNWARQSNFFKLSTYPTGTLRESASTRNVLFNMSLCRELGLRFHERLNLVGSSDTFFFEEAHKKGSKIVWIDEALVSETLPLSRVTEKWVWNRAFRHGNSRVVRQRIRKGNPGAFQLLPLACLKIITGGLEWLLFFWNGKVHRIGKFKRICTGFGMLSAIFGFTYQEYKRTHGH